MKNPERPNIFDEIEDVDDSTHAESNARKDKYRENLKTQRAELAKQDKANKLGRSILEQMRDVTFKSTSSEFAHHGHKLFKKFYAAMDYDSQTEFMNKSESEKEKIFLDWVEAQNK